MKKLEKQAAELSQHFEEVLIHLLRAQANAKGDFAELNKQESNLIFVLGERGASIMRELANALRLHVSTVTGIVDKLIEKEMITRERSETDRRIVRVDLTEKGKLAYEQEAEKRKQMSLILLGCLSKGEREDLLELFAKIAAELKKNQTA